jgi:primosomal protein N''
MARMEAVEKTIVRLRHWMSHNEHHLSEYEKVAADLEAAGHEASAAQIREMVALSKTSNECLEKALQALES